MVNSYETLLVRSHPAFPAVLEVCINRPEVRNAFNEKVIEELLQVFQTEALDEFVRAVVLKGTGSVFCAGGDLNWMKKSIEMDRAANLADTTKLTKMFEAMNECPKPLVAAIQGAAIGGGVGLVSVCDIAVATVDTQFSLSEVRLGIIPACIGPFVIAKIGASHARSLFVSAERFDAVRAREIGLVHEVVAGPADLEKSIERILGNLVQCGPKAMTAAKRLVIDLSWPEKRAKHPDPLDYVAKMLAEIRTSPEGQEGVLAFLEKRKPAWLQKSAVPLGEKK